MMRRARFLLLILFTIYFIYLTIPTEWLGGTPRGYKYLYEFDKPGIFVEQCQFLDTVIQGDEGSAHSEDFRLRGILTIFRHGERSPVTNIKSRPKPDCTPHADVDRQAFNSYTKLVKSLEFTRFLKIDPKYRYKAHHPHPYKCEIGQMSAEGALMLIKLGSFMHDKYKSAELFRDIEHADILVSSSLYQRTFQSAIAFISTFFYVLPNLKEIFLKASNTTYFCLDYECRCPGYDKTRLLSESHRVEEFIKRSPKRLFNRLQLLGEIVGLEVVEHPLQFQDVMLGRYICRQSTLPCNSNGECFTVDDYVQMADESDSIARRMFEKTSKDSRRMSLIEAWTLLRHLSNITSTARNTTRGRKIIRILSGHDITLEPLIQLLSINHRIPPHYSSRLVFEIYETFRPYDGESIFVRLIFNGKDYTSNMKFCQPLINGMCRASILEDFAKTGILKLLDVNRFEELCV